MASDIKDENTMECPVCKGSGNDLEAEIEYEKETGTNVQIPCYYCGGKGSIKMITLTEAQTMLGKNTVICLEPAEMMTKKINEGIASELWCFNVFTGISGRGDERYFDVRAIDRGGWIQLAIWEEPKIRAKSGEMRVVGDLIVESCRGIIVVREAEGLNGTIYELKASSISKGELAPENIDADAFIQSNPQRIMGTMAIYFIELDELPEASENEVHMSWEAFCQATKGNGQDGRSLAAGAVRIYR